MNDKTLNRLNIKKKSLKLAIFRAISAESEAKKIFYDCWIRY